MYLYISGMVEIPAIYKISSLKMLLTENNEEI